MKFTHDYINEAKIYILEIYTSPRNDFQRNLLRNLKICHDEGVVEAKSA